MDIRGKSLCILVHYSFRPFTDIREQQPLALFLRITLAACFPSSSSSVIVSPFLRIIIPVSINEPLTIFLAFCIVCYFFHFVRSAHDTYLRSAFRHTGSVRPISKLRAITQLAKILAQLSHLSYAGFIHGKSPT